VTQVVKHLPSKLKALSDLQYCQKGGREGGRDRAREGGMEEGRMEGRKEVRGRERKKKEGGREGGRERERKLTGLREGLDGEGRTKGVTCPCGCWW
jgi:hypothetical protein